MLLLIIAVLSWAGPVDQQQAEKNVKAFFSSQSRRGAKGIRGIRKQPKDLLLNKVAEVADAYYVFNIQDGGFVIASANDQVPAVLGYADSGSFDVNDIPESMCGWLEGMTAEIQAIREGLGTSVTSTENDRSPLAPMVTTKWRQGSSSGSAYNYQCPQVTYTGQTTKYYCLTGCVATAMAQIMKYHEWPKDKCETIPSYTSGVVYSNINAAGTLAALPGVVFNWADMKDTYSKEPDDDVTAQAVAQLMRYCGQSVEMKYSPSSSSATTSKIVTALKKYFGYDEDLGLVYRSNCTLDDWNDHIYKELAEKRPVLISGQSSGGGHAFICDGYDADDYFHINWGWGGSSDGFFLLSVLNPYDNSGSGASSTRDGYSASNYAVVGIQAPDGETTSDVKIDADHFSYDGSTIGVYIHNRTGSMRTFDYGCAIKNDDGSLEVFNITLNQKLDNQYYFKKSFHLEEANLADGTYHLYIVFRWSESSEWQFCSSNYFTVVVENGVISIIIPEYKLNVKEFTVMSDGYTKTPQILVAKIENTGDLEYYNWLYLFMEGTDTYLARTGSTVSAGRESDISFFYTPAVNAGTYRIWIATDDKGNDKIGEGTLTFEELSKEVFVSLTPLSTTTVDGTIYMTTTDFKAQLLIFNNTDSKQNVKLWANIKGPDKNGAWNGNYDVDAHAIYTVNYTSTLKDGNTYTLYLYKDNTKTDSWQDPITFTVSTTTGIQGVTDTTQEKEPVYYDLQGRQVAHPTKGIYIINKKKVIIK
mgnify:FL=1